MTDQAIPPFPTDQKIGIPEIDDQHDKMFQFLGELESCRGKRYTFAKAKDILERLSVWSETHFAIEESMMRLLGYPDEKSHVASHQELTKQLWGIRSHLLDEDMANKLQGKIEAWLIDHIENADRLFVEHFLNAKVISSRNDHGDI